MGKRNLGMYINVYSRTICDVFRYAKDPKVNTKKLLEYSEVFNIKNKPKKKMTLTIKVIFFPILLNH